MLLAGCGGGPSRVVPAEPAALNVYVPCILSGPIQKVVAAYEEANPGLEVSVRVDKPMAMLEAVPGEREAAGTAITTGEREMETLVAAGAVDPADVRTIAVNSYPVVVVAAAEAIPEVKSVSDLKALGVRRVYIQDPSKSSLGARAEEGLKQMGLWESVAPKIARPEADAMIPGELIDGKADAAIVFRDCLLGESGGHPPKTLRVIGEVPQEGLPPIPYQAAVLAKAPDPEAARRFIAFLVSEEGRQALESAGLTPVGTP